MNVFLFGTGSWAKEILLSLIKFKNLNLFIISKKQHIFKWLSKKKIKNLKVVKNLPLNKRMIKSSVIIASKNKDHKLHTNLALKKKYKNIFIEKPLSNKINDLKFFSKKKNLFSSRIFAFDKIFNELKNKLNLKNIYKIKLVWHDQPNSKKGGKKDRHDKSIPYSYDVFLHLMSILNIFYNFKKKDIKNFTLKNNSNKKSNFKFFLKNKKIECDLNRDSKRVRKITFFSSNCIFYLDFSKNDKYLFTVINNKSNVKKSQIIKKKIDNLDKMLMNFLFNLTKKKNIRIRYNLMYSFLYKKCFKI